MFYISFGGGVASVIKGLANFMDFSDFCQSPTEFVVGDYFIFFPLNSVYLFVHLVTD